MRAIARRALILGMVGPVLLALLTAFGWRGRGYSGWRYLVVIVGGGYLIPVLGTLVGWKLVAIPRKAGSVVSFVLRALVGIVLISSLLMVVTTRSPGEIRDTAMWLFGSANGLALLVIFGVSYASLPLIARRVQQRK